VPTTDDGLHLPEPKWRHNVHKHLKQRILRVHSQQEGEVQIKPWVMRLYYHDAFIFSRLLDGTATEVDCTTPLVYFAATELQEARLRELRGEDFVLRGQGVMDQAMPTRVSSPRIPAIENAEVGGEAKEEKGLTMIDGPPYCPTFIWLRAFIIEVDCCMRYMHLGIYGFVLLGRYVQIMNDSAGTFSCDKLITYFANAG